MNKKRILLFTTYFYPESFKVNEIAFELVEKGHEVTVVTGIPNYPKGKFYEGYGLFSKRTEVVQGVKVIRLPLIPRGNGGAKSLALNYFSFLVTSVIYAFYVGLRKRFDVVFVNQLSPVFIAVPGIIVKKIQNIPMYMWVLDLWPESVTAASSFSNSSIIRLLNNLVKWIYSNCEKILITSKGFRESILGKGDFESKIVYFPNWAETVFEENFLTDNIPSLPNGFKIMYAGNIGEAQDLENVMSAALQLKHIKDIKWIIIGDGRKRTWVEQFVRKNELHDHVFMMGSYPLETMPSFFKQADSMLLTLKPDDIFSKTVPGRLQSYMACGKPTLAMIDGEAAQVVMESASGLVCKSGDIESFISNVLLLYNLSEFELKELGDNAKKYYNANFKKEKVFEALHNILA